ncbi:hypothetical protein Zmor_007530 [Zophobas morio]|uniref:Uncharacterized protein n=1 Tax=Zophobas morio TaxID=2755281 RepID=A0AA38IXI0_9CUCU|nr:hypothetical protein Zmor_007530 [Zophobas morio]
MGDSSSVTAAGRRSLKKSLEAEVAVGALDKYRSGDGGLSRTASGSVRAVQAMGEVESSQIHSSRVGIILSIIVVESVM